MSFLDNIMGSDNKLSDKDIAMDVLKDSKFGVESLSVAVSEAVDPQLRNMLSGQLTSAVNEHFKLSDMLIKKGWYPAYDSPDQQLRSGYNESQKSV